MHRCQACTLPGMLKTSQLVVAQREVSIAAFRIGAGALEHLSEHHRFVLEMTLFSWIQLAQCPSGLKKGCAKALGPLSKRSALTARLGGRHPVEIIRRDQMRMHGIGLWLC